LQDHETALREMRQRFEKDLVEQRERMLIEKESWESMFMRKQEAALKAKVMSLFRPFKNGSASFNQRRTSCVSKFKQTATAKST
jgi:hypothetical protein